MQCCRVYLRVVIFHAFREVCCLTSGVAVLSLERYTQSSECLTIINNTLFGGAMRFFSTITSIVILLSGTALVAWFYHTGDLMPLLNEHASVLYSVIGLLGLMLVQVVVTYFGMSFRKESETLDKLAAEQVSVEQSKSKDAVNTEWILDALAGGVITANMSGRVLYMNQSAEKMLGCVRDDALNQSLDDVISLEDMQGHPVVQRVFELHRSNTQQLLQFGQVKFNPKEGEHRFIDLSTTHIADGKNWVVFILRDVTAARKIINRLYQQASHDALTGLMNRRSFEEYLEQSAHEAGVRRSSVLVSIDLDNFKIVNDTCGHMAGDELLKQISHIFQRSVRQSDKVGRMGGDEFAMLLEGCELEKGRSVMESVLTEVRNYRFSWESKVFSIAASIGLLEFTPSPDVKVKELFAEVDKACYTAKALGRNQIFVHVSNENEEMAHQSQQRNTDWGKLLQSAIQHDRFILFAQPILPLTENPLPYVQYEVLLRLPFRKHLLSPGSFLPAADRLDMMGRIDRWIIRKVIEMAAGYELGKDTDLEPRLMINLSSQAVQDPDLFAYIDEQVKRVQIDPNVLCFEIAESVAIANFVQTKRLMKALHELGCHLVLDDFGSGFSSLNYVRDLPLSYLKIDGNFVHNLVSNPVDAAMVKAVHEVGQVMKLFTIAELVEDKETLDHLKLIGVDYAQGYYCGKPFPLEHVCQQGIGNDEHMRRAI